MMKGQRVDNSEHWKKRWIEWWEKWPDGKFPRGTHAVMAKSRIKTGQASDDCYEGMIAAALEISKKQEENRKKMIALSNEKCYT